MTSQFHGLGANVQQLDHIYPDKRVVGHASSGLLEMYAVAKRYVTVHGLKSACEEMQYSIKLVHVSLNSNAPRLLCFLTKTSKTLEHSVSMISVESAVHVTGSRSELFLTSTETAEF